jgi:hypothetical protein
MKRPDGRMLLGAAKRFFAFVVVACVVACLSGLLLGALLHEGTRRGIAIGFYVTGMALAGAGFLLGSRPPVRRKSKDGDVEGASATGGFQGLPGPISGGLTGPVSESGGKVRWATREEHFSAMNFPAVLIAIGITLVVVGAFVDGRHL